jgi:hypothetical protein
VGAVSVRNNYLKASVRTVIEDVSVSEIIDQEQAIYPRLRDAFEALKWSLSHRPEDGELLDDLHWLYKQSGDREHKIPALVVIYIFDDWQVQIKFVLVRVPSV